MSIFRDFDSKPSKISVRFEISTLGIGYMRNFAEIRKLILFRAKCNFEKTNVRFEISTFWQIFIIRKLTLINLKYSNLGIWARSLEKKSL